MKLLITFVSAFILNSSALLAEQVETKSTLLVDAALEQTNQVTIYNPTYFKIPYPNGDIPSRFGVCTDVVIRAYRKLGIDLQKEVHQDIKAYFSIYPAKQHWNQSKPDTNIDHRRVPNLQIFFSRKGKKLIVTDNADDYQPGDLVTWMLGNKLPHIGIVANIKSKDGERYLIVHNIGAGPQLEDVLFTYPISGHYRYALD